MPRTSPRIVLDQDNPKVGDEVTFTVEAKGADEIRLVIGARAAYWPPVNMLQDDTGELNDGFVLGYAGTAVAWLIKNNEAVAGTLFTVASGGTT